MSEPEVVSEREQMSFEQRQQIIAELAEVIGDYVFDTAVEAISQNPAFVPDWDDVTGNLFRFASSAEDIVKFQKVFPNAYSIQELFERFVKKNEKFDEEADYEDKESFEEIRNFLNFYPDFVPDWSDIKTHFISCSSPGYLIDFQKAFPEVFSIDEIFERLLNAVVSEGVSFIYLVDFVIELNLNNRAREVYLVEVPFVELPIKEICLSKLVESFPNELDEDFVLEAIGGVAL